MTKSRRQCRAAGSQASGITASSPGDYAWNVNFNNGNANWNNQDNDNHVRAVRASEYHGAPSFRALHAAWRRARRGKKPSPNQLSFDSQWIDGLLQLEQQLTAGTWQPRPTTCFIATAPKAREIHAPDFADRIVHHWVVPQLEAIYEPTFIFDSFSNRRRKGTHAAVDRLQGFMREVHSGQGGGHYLQLDIKNFFNRIHRPTLYAQLKARMERHGLSIECRRAVHALLRRSPLEAGVTFACTPTERERVPPHKRLDQAPAGCGIPIGNLSSQFFANVYLDRLDQFVKRTLRAPRYLRYVDDFVLVHESREQLEAWQAAIAAFLLEELRLELKADVKLRPITAGADFLGYVIFPTYRIVRRRVIGHCLARLHEWERHHVRDAHIVASRQDLDRLRSVCASYGGHFSHASSWRLRHRMGKQFPWLYAIFPDRRRRPP
jgi:RNA-directed DNA polymerase